MDASYTRSQVQEGVLALQFVPSELQVADFFTKPHTRAQHLYCLFKLSVYDPPLVWGGGVRIGLLMHFLICI